MEIGKVGKVVRGLPDDHGEAALGREGAHRLHRDRLGRRIAVRGGGRSLVGLLVFRRTGFGGSGSTRNVRAARATSALAAGGRVVAP